MSTIIFDLEPIDSTEAVEQPKFYKTSDKKLLSVLVSHQLPQFIREDHQKFIIFMEAYYEWMESYKNVEYNINRFENYTDIDKTLSDFIIYFQREFLSNIPSNIVTDKVKLIKHIKDFYRAKGTEKSYKLFFNMLYGSSSELYYPRTDIFKLSHGKWVLPKTLKVKNIIGNPFDLKGKKIIGKLSGATGYVENIHFSMIGHLEVYELFLNSSSIIGVFDPLENIITENNDIECGIYPLIVGNRILDGGLGYQENQEIPVTSNAGEGIKIIINNVDSNGKILSLLIENFGANYGNDASIPNPVLPGVINTAIIEPIIGAIANYKGYYLNEDGQISTTKYLHDGFFYQQFSYVTYVDQSLHNYKSALTEILHPIGLKLFGGFRVENSLDVAISYDTELLLNVSTEIVDVSQIQASIEIKVDLETESYPSSLNVGGPMYLDIERDKFNYRPYPNMPDEMLDGNTYYGPPFGENDYTAWETQNNGNYQIKDFENLILSDFEDFPTKPINILPEIEIIKTEIP